MVGKDDGQLDFKTSSGATRIVGEGVSSIVRCMELSCCGGRYRVRSISVWVDAQPRKKLVAARRERAMIVFIEVV